MTRHEQPVIQPEAYGDIVEIRERIRRVSGANAARKSYGRILASLELLGPNPYLGPLHHDPVLERLGYRKLVMGRYVAVYRVEGDIAYVLRVFPGPMDYARVVE